MSTIITPNFQKKETHSLSGKEIILISGAGPNGITGKSIKTHFQKKYTILSPGYHELNLTDDSAVRNYFNENKIDYVIHCATDRLRPTFPKCSNNNELESNLRMFFSLAAQAESFKKMIYFGSGAEFDKSTPIVNVQETSFGKSIPKNQYGLGKYIMNLYARKSSNIYNLRLFGTINKHERYTKNIISNLCAKAVERVPLIIKKDCRFSFVYIADVINLIEQIIEKTPSYNDYNLVTSENYLLSDLAKIVLNISKEDLPLIIGDKALNPEYTGCNRRLINEFNIHFTPIEESIRHVYNHFIKNNGTIDLNIIDNRWEKIKNKK